MDTSSINSHPSLVTTRLAHALDRLEGHLLAQS